VNFLINDESFFEEGSSGKTCGAGKTKKTTGSSVAHPIVWKLASYSCC